METVVQDRPHADGRYALLKVERLNPTIGAYVSGVDLTQPYGEDVAAELRQALADHMVIFLRDQPLDFAAHRRLAAVFGEAHVAPSTKPWRVPGFDEITKMHADHTSKYVAGEDWHSDMSCDPQPPMGSILYLHTIPPLGGDTVFSSMYAAWDALSDRMRAQLQGLTATHDGVKAFGGLVPEGMTLPCTSHPIARTHPVTGRKALYVNRGFTTRIDGVSERESEALLGFLFEHVQSPMFQCRFTWSPHAIAIWDNRCGQHMAIWDYFPQVRSGYRIQIKGETPV
ncbi:TauD/TfdA dioxygenase family protein [Novosphingobium sp. Leaf2]|uniref:TauD/TfdA dioxygenase family protein n=1 Tax=Novosphingobium sp. Leaf2 TaxID=1735670 RepID=UPI0006FE3A5C|nr:TauD/TfdA family dioxygenase [Novosphingobium sp. Leaf2]KQM14744.1 taurine dioxygenase [Novosphingobium sp. Leaf2]